MKRYIGVYGAAGAWLISQLHEKHRKIIIFSAKRKAAEELFQDLHFFIPDSPIVQLPPWDTLPFENVSPQIEVTAQRLHTLHTLMTEKSYICVVPPEGALQRVLPKEFLKQLSFQLSLGDTIARQELLTKIDNAGYQRVSLVEKIGDCAVRGGVIDLFPFGSDTAVRLEFFGDTIEKIKLFSVATQRSITQIKTLQVLPLREIIPFHSNDYFGEKLSSAITNIKQRSRELETPLRETAKVLSALRDGSRFPSIELANISALGSLATIFDYAAKDTLFVNIDKQVLLSELEAASTLISERHTRLAEDHYLIPKQSEQYLLEEELFAILSTKKQLEIDSLHIATSLTEERDYINIRSIPNTQLSTQLQAKVGQEEAWKPLSTALKTWRKHGNKIIFVVGSETRVERLQKLLLDLGSELKFFNGSLKNWFRLKDRYPLAVLIGNLSNGFQLPDKKLVFISENEIFSRRSQRTRKIASERTIKRLLNSLAQLKDNDFVVHEDYGVGLYHGLVHLTVENIQGDFLHLEYADSKLYIPIQNISRVQKYVGIEGQSPKLDKLSSQRWAKTKLKVREAVLALAGDLIRLYAARSISKGFCFEPHGPDDEVFADYFEFDETPDQLQAIKAVLNDMASEKPMDRLICGDVGFGKTEVALRAAFKCIQAGLQVCILVPTTVLVEQHKQSFIRRFADYPVTVAALSRFYSTADNKKTIEGLANHKIDIVIGTHKLLQRDIAFKDLGLLIIDEEHRFGVQQKERLKQLKKQVDVLTLTATPIPRTLQMSLLNIRDITVITTPPVDRRVIKTYIATRNEILIRDALIREHQRGGQAFFVHNRVQSILGVSAALSELVPEMRVECAHGQMSEIQIENIMRRFVNHEIDVLVSTTIIESGLDIPNANTIIIDRADMFGLAQLYQLRGRVGRSTKQAYAYFLIPNTKRLGAEAQQRLKVLQSLDDLGLGFNLAVRDLEIRGAGNLLGKEQSGNVVSVGYELYTKILHEAISHIKGEELELESLIDPEVKLPVNAFIPEYYVPDISERLVLYQRLASIRSSEEAQELTLELEDRFGPLTPEVRNLVEMMRLRSLLRVFGVTKAEWSRGKLYLSFSPNAKVDIQKLLLLEKNAPKTYKFGKNLTLSIVGEEQAPPPFDMLYIQIEALLRRLIRD
ncbi:MAG: transcription-repair coupling factor [Bdellovibrionota bacterium]|jgi:transcription-repair coupling factor (superfamily II helicase)